MYETIPFLKKKSWYVKCLWKEQFSHGRKGKQVLEECSLYLIKKPSWRDLIPAGSQHSCSPALLRTERRHNAERNGLGHFTALHKAPARPASRPILGAFLWYELCSRKGRMGDPGRAQPTKGSAHQGPCLGVTACWRAWGDPQLMKIILPFLLHHQVQTEYVPFHLSSQNYVPGKF